LSVLAINGMITLVVEDNGPGIPEAERERVFDPFYRVLGSDEIGSGLGLSIVKTIATRVGAKVSLGFANDQSRSGLRVMVTFPWTMS
jgi:two-component system OmpR family sensor kinase